MAKTQQKRQEKHKGASEAPPVKLHEVSCSFGTKTVLESLSFTLRPGELTTLLGLNGAGKTTTMRILTGLLIPTAGDVWIRGVEPSEEPARVRQLMGVLPEENILGGDLTVAEHFQLVAGLTGWGRKKAKKRTEELVELFELSSHFHAMGGVLSKGFRQRVGLALALFNDPEILILDEPSSGLDPEQQKAFHALLKEISVNKTVLLSSHLLPDVKRLAERVLVIAGGRLTFDGPHPGDDELRKALLGEALVEGSEN